ncbi:MAG: TerD family protein [Deltaproteobacteria bacterium]|jgi:tellurite resistance protein TerA|nr:TerD family protein [Deltaproteobacteria bacterium]
MKEIVKGQKIKISELTSSRKLNISISLDWNQSSDVDIACFGLDDQGRLSDDQYFIFYNQKKSPEGAIELVSQAKAKADFVVDLERLPAKIRRLTFTVAVDGSTPISALGQSRLTIAEAAGDSPALTFNFQGADFTKEKAIMLLDVYFKDEWRVGANAQGFSQGLKALLEHFGGTALDAPAPSSPPPVDKAASKDKVSLKKITLDKPGESTIIDLAKKPQGTTSFHINLNWDQVEKKKGWFGGKETADLDLGCMFELPLGLKGVIQALGGNMGSKTDLPFIYLDKDDRTGASSEGENLYILKPEIIQRVLVFAYIYEGDFKFTEVNARVTIKEPNGDEISIKLNNPDRVNRFCAICMLKNENGQIKVSKEEKYLESHVHVDVAYRFGFKWVAGRK